MFNLYRLPFYYLISIWWMGFCLQFNDLQECYLQKRRQLANKSRVKEEKDTDVVQREGYSAGLADFQSVLSTFTRYRYNFMSLICWTCLLLFLALVLFLFTNFSFVLYSRLRVIAELRHGDLFHSANIVSRQVWFLHIIEGVKFSFHWLPHVIFKYGN